MPMRQSFDRSHSLTNPFPTTTTAPDLVNLEGGALVFRFPFLLVRTAEAASIRRGLAMAL